MIKISSNNSPVGQSSREYLSSVGAREDLEGDRVVLEDGTLVQSFVIKTLGRYEVSALMNDTVVAITPYFLSTMQEAYGLARNIVQIALKSGNQRSAMRDIKSKLGHLLSFE